MKTIECVTTESDWLQLRKICEFKPIHQSNQSMRRTEPKRNNTHQYQWIEEKEDCSIRVCLPTRIVHCQSLEFSMTGICSVKTRIHQKYRSDQSTNLPHSMELSSVLFGFLQRYLTLMVPLFQNWCNSLYQWHRMMRKWENGYLRIGGNRCSGSSNHRSRFH